MKMKFIALALLVQFLVLVTRVTECTKKTVRVVYPKQVIHNPVFYKYYYKYPYYKYKYKKRKWPKIRGRCKISPKWEINGTNPVLREASKGRVVLLFLMKRTCKFCLSQLESLNDLAGYYQEIGRKVSFVALTHKNYPLAKRVKKLFPFIPVYEEPVGKNVFGLLRGSWGHVFIYDTCGRQQYHFGYPYSWLGYSFVQSAIKNTENHHERLCGLCGPGEGGTAKIPTTERPSTRVPVKDTPSVKRIRDINGPFTLR